MKAMLIPFLLLFIFSCAAKAIVLPEKPARSDIESADGKLVTVQGRLRLVGSEPGPVFVITPASNEFDIGIRTEDQELIQTLKKYQERPVKGTGILKVALFSYKNTNYNHKEYFIDLKSIEKTGEAGY